MVSNEVVVKIAKEIDALHSSSITLNSLFDDSPH